ncbi:MAG: hypothetical protein L0Y56_21125 [Nitrospira sp.]|nr:hypothetical protein [Nitrospira sp.]
MKTFEVYSHSAYGYEAVKNGFSWPAFFFTWIWAFSKGLVIHGFATIGVWVVLFVLEKYFEEQRDPGGQMFMLFLQFGLCWLLGQSGNTWRVNRLKKRGFQHLKTLEAETPSAAITGATNSVEIAKKELAATGFERFDTKSHLEAVDVLFSRAVPSLPVVTTEDIRRICGQYLKYDLENGRRHVAGTEDHLRPFVVRNLERVPSQLSAGQRIIGFQVFVQSELQFAMLNVFVGDAQGTPGYAFGARFWRTTDQVFVLGWEGFQLSF